MSCLSTNQKKLMEFLLKPIVIKGRKVLIKIDKDCIVSGQKYYGCLDQDMSDVSIAFYEIIYQDCFDNLKLLDSKGYLIDVDKEFAGDTMNTFETIANLVPQAGKSSSLRTDEENWPSFLKQYHSQYLRLANFWLLPSAIGRRSKKDNYYDSMQLFLHKLSLNFDEYKIKYPKYFKNINNFKQFLELHFLDGLKLNQSQELQSYKFKQADVLISEANKMIKLRAEAIANSKYSEKLYEYFKNHGL